MTKIPFKISARTASLIGKENIATAEGAIIELVKNAYDADATDCIIFFDKDSKSKSILYIIDNGDGMNKEIIEDYWMTIGTSNKLHEPYTKNQRIKSGAKGIGRFALDRLGKSAQMFTLPKGKNKGYEWNANWTEFNEEKTLDQVYASIDETDNLNLTKKLSEIVVNHRTLKKYLKKIKFPGGTIFKIENLNDDWDEHSLNTLFKNLDTLVPPKEEASDFKITLLSCNHVGKFGEIKNIHWADYDYRLQVKFTADKIFAITINRREFNWKGIDPDVFKEKEPQNMSKRPYNLETLKKGKFSFKNSINDIWPGNKDQEAKEIVDSLGPFDFTFFYLRRTEKDEDKRVFSQRNINTEKRTKFLERFGGIKLFRDNFRIRPYGEIRSNSFDWLGLGRRANTSSVGQGQKQGVGWRVEPQQVYGIINISRITNGELKDTTNREGLVENKTFHVFQELILRLINIIEKDRHYIMRPMRVVYDRKHNIEKAKEEAKEQAKVDLENIPKSKSLKSAKNTTYAKAVVGFEQELIDKEDEIKMLRSLASIGMTISTFSHELHEIRNYLLSYSKKLKQFIYEEINKEKFDAETKFIKNPFLLSEKLIKVVLELSNWIDFTNQSIKKDRRKATNLSLSTYFGDFKNRWEEILETRGVKLIIDKSLNQHKLKKAFPIDLDSIFNNLVLNSLDAFYRKDSSSVREIYITSSDEDGGLNIIYEDSGPGLLGDIKIPEVIFEPFFTTKKKDNDEVGIGLGMWIVKTTVEEYNGYVEILKSRPKFKMKIFFPKYSK